MMDFDFIERLLKAFDDSGVDSLELERGGTRVRLAKTPPLASAPMMPAAAPAPIQTLAPSPTAERLVDHRPREHVFHLRAYERSAFARLHVLEIDDRP